MKIDNIITDNDLINFLLDQHRQTLNPNFMVLAHTIERYKREIQMLQWQLSEREWISVEDRLPKSKVNCLVHYKHSYCDDDGYYAIGLSFYNGEGFQIDLAYKVTHWMPLPAPPTENNC